MTLFPILQSFDVYESTHQIIIIGRNEEETIFKIIKIARWTLNEKEVDCYDWFLNVTEDQYVYKYEDIEKVRKSLITMTSAKLIIENACGIIGFVRFKRGYYMILITKKSQVASFGQHKIYKVDETSIFYLPGNTISPWDQSVKTSSNSYLPQTKHPEEKKYLTLFNSVDLSIDNYFSYTYDLSNSVQYNFAYSSMENKSNTQSFSSIQKYQLLLNDRYVWNWSLWPPSLRPSKERMDSGCSWLVALIHGYVGQSCIVAGAGCVQIKIALIARRSRHFAGTRFLKRGANQQGNVANEVESEQIIYEEEGTLFEKSKVTSLVQFRGSIPLQWHQEMKKVVGKPPIKMTMEDAYYFITGRHFASLLYRHGGPIVILNLVKQRERHSFEQPLSIKFVDAINYLKSSFIDSDLKNNILEYIEFDMARIQRGKVKSVLEKLAPVAEDCIRKTGFFCSDTLLNRTDKERVLTKTIQCGLVRTNCIDCLDRTNTAQFVIGQAALGYQLYILGIINSPCISSIQSLDRMLQSLYENHGNVLALQYGGSELVHNVETYRKNAKFSTQSRDFMQTISRYYNNKFSDQVKQMSINIFLGIFKPWQIGNDCIWNHKNSDMFLHDTFCNTQLEISQHFATNWLPLEVLVMIPKPLILWHKWKALNYLILYGNTNNLIDDSFSRDLEFSADCISALSKCEFTYRYNHLVGDRNYFLSTISFSHSLIPDNEERKNSIVYLNGNANWNKYDTESIPELDAVSTLTNGPVMQALRNKSVSSNSTSDSSDDENYNIERRNRSEAFIHDNVSTINSSGYDQILKSKWLNFCIRDYGDLSTNIGDCVNSSSTLYDANSKLETPIKKSYDSDFNYSKINVSASSSKLYEDTVRFNRSGIYKTLNKEYYQHYIETLDFGKRSM